jgi:uncharacterized protein YaaQ
VSPDGFVDDIEVRMQDNSHRLRTSGPDTVHRRGCQVKLVVVVLSNAQTDDTVGALLQKGHRVTRLSTTGGLLRQGNTTLMVGTEDTNVEAVLETVREQAQDALAIVLPLERYERL